MRQNLLMGCSVWAMLLIMVLPGNGAAVGTPDGPDSNNDWLADDPHWSATPGWCWVMIQNDLDKGEWGTGITYYDVYYRDTTNDPNDQWDLYIWETTIPWIGIQMQGGQMIRYGYSNTTSQYHLKPIGYTYHNYTPNQPYTGLYVDYELDFDGDSTIEWKFHEKIEFQPPSQPPNPPQTGYYTLEMRITQFPPNWNHNNTPIQTIEIPFFIDANVYNNPSNWFYSGQPGNWNLVQIESFCNAANIQAKIANGPGPEDIALTITPNPQGCNPASQQFTFLIATNSEYADTPLNYIDGDPLEGQNGLVWYVETYNVQVNPPPNPINGGWTGIKCEGFVDGPPLPPP